MYVTSVTVQEYRYVSDDGKREFKTKEECEKYEKEHDYVAKARRYFEEHEIMGFYPHEDRVGQYAGFDGYEGSLIKLDDFVLEWLDFVSQQSFADKYLCRGRMEPLKGQLVFLGYSSFGCLEDWYCAATIDDILQTMAEDMDMLNEIRKENQ